MLELVSGWEEASHGDAEGEGRVRLHVVVRLPTGIGEHARVHAGVRCTASVEQI